MNSSASTSSRSHRLHGRPERTPSGPRPLSTASSRSSIASGSSTLTRESSIDTVRQEVYPAQSLLTADQPHTRRLSLVSTASQYSTFSNATTLPSIEGGGVGFDMLSEQFDELMRQLQCAPEPVVASRDSVVSRATTSASKASSAAMRPAPSFVSSAPASVVAPTSSTTASTKEVASAGVSRTNLSAHHRRTSSMSTSSTLGPETNSDHFTVSAFPQPPSTMPQRLDTYMAPASPPHARQSFKSHAMPDTLGHSSPKHASWTGTLLYIDSTKVSDTKELQPDLEAQYQLEKAENRTTHGGQRERHPVLFGCAVYFLPILILAIITVIIFLIARYR